MFEPIFFAKKEKDQFYLPEDELHHLTIFRIKIPEKILFTAGDGKLYSGIVKKNGIIKDIVIVDSSIEDQFINLYFGLCDKNRMKFIFEKGTEIGVKSFNPIITKKSEKFFIKKERVENILKAAIKQSRRLNLPEYNEPKPIKNIDFDKNVDSYFGSLERKHKKDIVFNSKYVNIFVGPPSGFTDDEEEFLMKNGVKPFFFDVGILRTETFAISILSIFHYLKGLKNG